jgi:hypothetical protein
MIDVISNGFCVLEPARCRGASPYGFLDPVAYSCIELDKPTDNSLSYKQIQKNRPRADAERNGKVV